MALNPLRSTNVLHFVSKCFTLCCFGLHIDIHILILTGDEYEDTDFVQRQHFKNVWGLVEEDVKFQILLTKNGQGVGKSTVGTQDPATGEDQLKARDLQSLLASNPDIRSTLQFYHPQLNAVFINYSSRQAKALFGLDWLDFCKEALRGSEGNGGKDDTASAHLVLSAMRGKDKSDKPFNRAEFYEVRQPEC